MTVAEQVREEAPEGANEAAPDAKTETRKEKRSRRRKRSKEADDPAALEASDGSSAEASTAATADAAVGEADANDAAVEGEAASEGDATGVDPEERPDLGGVLEAVLFAAAEPVPIRRLNRLLTSWSRSEIQKGLKALGERFEAEGRGIRLLETAGGFQLRSSEAFSPWVRRFFAEKPPRLSRPVLETLAIVAYRQPVTRGEVEQVRGVNCDAVLSALVTRDLIRVVGRRQTPGRPVEYGTTDTFLELFSLKNVDELPPLPDPASLAKLMEGAEGGEDAEGGSAGDAEAAEGVASEGAESVATEGAESVATEGAASVAADGAANEEVEGGGAGEGAAPEDTMSTDAAAPGDPTDADGVIVESGEGPVSEAVKALAAAAGAGGDAVATIEVDAAVDAAEAVPSDGGSSTTGDASGEAAAVAGESQGSLGADEIDGAGGAPSEDPESSGDRVETSR